MMKIVIDEIEYEEKETRGGCVAICDGELCERLRSYKPDNDCNADLIFVRNETV